MSLVGVNGVPALLVISRILFYFSDKMLRGGSWAVRLVVILHWAGPLTVFTYDMDSQVRPV